MSICKLHVTCGYCCKSATTTAGNTTGLSLFFIKRLCLYLIPHCFTNIFLFFFVQEWFHISGNKQTHSAEIHLYIFFHIKINLSKSIMINKSLFETSMLFNLPLLPFLYIFFIYGFANVTLHILHKQNLRVLITMLITIADNGCIIYCIVECSVLTHIMAA